MSEGSLVKSLIFALLLLVSLLRSSSLSNSSHLMIVHRQTKHAVGLDESLRSSHLPHWQRLHEPLVQQDPKHLYHDLDQQ